MEILPYYTSTLANPINVIELARPNKTVRLNRHNCQEILYLANFEWKFSVYLNVVSIERRRPDRTVPIICDIELRTIDIDGAFQTYSFEDAKFKKFDSYSELQPWEGYQGNQYTIDKDWNRVDIDITVKTINGKPMNFEGYEETGKESDKLVMSTIDNQYVLMHTNMLIAYVPSFVTIHMKQLLDQKRNPINYPVKASSFIEILMVSYPTRKPITLYNFHELHRLSKFLSMAELKMKCMRFFNGLPNTIKLHLAWKYLMHDVYNEIMESLTTREDINNFKTQLIQEKLSSEMIERDLDERVMSIAKDEGEKAEESKQKNTFAMTVAQIFRF